MAIFATAGSAFYIGGTLEPDYASSMSQSDFAGETWTQVEPLETIGSFGDTAEEVTTTLISDARVRRLKGARDAGVLELVAGLDYSDAGQLAMLDAEGMPHNYAFKVTFNDAPAGGTPSERMFVGMVMSASEQLDGANNVMKVNFRIAINSNVVRVFAAEA